MTSSQLSAAGVKRSKKKPPKHSLVSVKSSYYHLDIKFDSDSEQINLKLAPVEIQTDVRTGSQSPATNSENEIVDNKKNMLKLGYVSTLLSNLTNSFASDKVSKVENNKSSKEDKNFTGNQKVCFEQGDCKVSSGYPSGQSTNSRQVLQFSSSFSTDRKYEVKGDVKEESEKIKRRRKKRKPSPVFCELDIFNASTSQEPHGRKKVVNKGKKQKQEKSGSSRKHDTDVIESGSGTVNLYKEIKEISNNVDNTEIYKNGNDQQIFFILPSVARNAPKKSQTHKKNDCNSKQNLQVQETPNNNVACLEKKKKKKKRIPRPSLKSEYCVSQKTSNVSQEMVKKKARSISDCVLRKTSDVSQEMAKKKIRSKSDCVSRRTSDVSQEMVKKKRRSKSDCISRRTSDVSQEMVKKKRRSKSDKSEIDDTEQSKKKNKTGLSSTKSELIKGIKKNKRNTKDVSKNNRNSQKIKEKVTVKKRDEDRPSLRLNNNKLNREPDSINRNAVDVKKSKDKAEIQTKKSENTSISKRASKDEKTKCERCRIKERKPRSSIQVTIKKSTNSKNFVERKSSIDSTTPIKMKLKTRTTVKDFKNGRDCINKHQENELIFSKYIQEYEKILRALEIQERKLVHSSDSSIRQTCGDGEHDRFPRPKIKCRHDGTNVIRKSSSRDLPVHTVLQNEKFKIDSLESVAKRTSDNSMASRRLSMYTITHNNLSRNGSCTTTINTKNHLKTSMSTIDLHECLELPKGSEMSIERIQKSTDLPLLRKEVSFSQLNLAPVLAFYKTATTFYNSTKILSQSHVCMENLKKPFAELIKEIRRRKRRSKQKPRLEKISSVSEAVTKKEKYVRSNVSKVFNDSVKQTKMHSSKTNTSKSNRASSHGKEKEHRIRKLKHRKVHLQLICLPIIEIRSSPSFNEITANRRLDNNVHVFPIIEIKSTPSFNEAIARQNEEKNKETLSEVVEKDPVVVSPLDNLFSKMLLVRNIASKTTLKQNGFSTTTSDKDSVDSPYPFDEENLLKVLYKQQIDKTERLSRLQRRRICPDNSNKEYWSHKSSTKRKNHSSSSSTSSQDLSPCALSNIKSPRKHSPSPSIGVASELSHRPLDNISEETHTESSTESERLKHTTDKDNDRPRIIETDGAEIVKLTDKITSMGNISRNFYRVKRFSPKNEHFLDMPEKDVNSNDSSGDPNNIPKEILNLENKIHKAIIRELEKAKHGSRESFTKSNTEIESDLKNYEEVITKYVFSNIKRKFSSTGCVSPCQTGQNSTVSSYGEVFTDDKLTENVIDGENKAEISHADETLTCNVPLVPKEQTLSQEVCSAHRRTSGEGVKEKSADEPSNDVSTADKSVNTDLMLSEETLKLLTGNSKSSLKSHRESPKKKVENQLEDVDSNLPNVSYCSIERPSSSSKAERGKQKIQLPKRALSDLESPKRTLSDLQPSKIRTSLTDARSGSATVCKRDVDALFPLGKPKNLPHSSCLFTKDYKEDSKCSTFLKRKRYGELLRTTKKKVNPCRCKLSEIADGIEQFSFTDSQNIIINFTDKNSNFDHENVQNSVDYCKKRSGELDDPLKKISSNKNSRSSFNKLSPKNSYYSKPNASFIVPEKSCYINRSKTPDSFANTTPELSDCSYKNSEDSLDNRPKVNNAPTRGKISQGFLGDCSKVCGNNGAGAPKNKNLTSFVNIAKLSSCTDSCTSKLIYFNDVSTPSTNNSKISTTSVRNTRTSSAQVSHEKSEVVAPLKNVAQYVSDTSRACYKKSRSFNNSLLPPADDSKQNMNDLKTKSLGRVPTNTKTYVDDGNVAVDTAKIEQEAVVRKSVIPRRRLQPYKVPYSGGSKIPIRSKITENNKPTPISTTMRSLIYCTDEERVTENETGKKTKIPIYQTFTVFTEYPNIPDILSDKYDFTENGYTLLSKDSSNSLKSAQSAGSSVKTNHEETETAEIAKTLEDLIQILSKKIAKKSSSGNVLDKSAYDIDDNNQVPPLPMKPSGLQSYTGLDGERCSGIDVKKLHAVCKTATEFIKKLKELLKQAEDEDLNGITTDKATPKKLPKKNCLLEFCQSLKKDRILETIASDTTDEIEPTDDDVIDKFFENVMRYQHHRQPNENGDNLTLKRVSSDPTSNKIVKNSCDFCELKGICSQSDRLIVEGEEKNALSTLQAESPNESTDSSASRKQRDRFGENFAKTPNIKMFIYHNTIKLDRDAMFRFKSCSGSSDGTGTGTSRRANTSGSSGTSPRSSSTNDKHHSPQRDQNPNDETHQNSKDYEDFKQDFALISEESVYERFKTKRVGSLRNIFKKGGSLLVMFNTSKRKSSKNESPSSDSAHKFDSNTSLGNSSKSDSTENVNERGLNALFKNFRKKSKTYFSPRISEESVPKSSDSVHFFLHKGKNKKQSNVDQENNLDRLFRETKNVRFNPGNESSGDKREKFEVDDDGDDTPNNFRKTDSKPSRNALKDFFRLFQKSSVTNTSDPSMWTYPNTPEKTGSNTTQDDLHELSPKKLHNLYLPHQREFYQRKVTQCQEYAEKVCQATKLREEGHQRQPEEFREIPLSVMLGQRLRSASYPKRDTSPTQTSACSLQKVNKEVATLDISRLTDFIPLPYSTRVTQVSVALSADVKGKPKNETKCQEEMSTSCKSTQWNMNDAVDFKDMAVVHKRTPCPFKCGRYDCSSKCKCKNIPYDLKQKEDENIQCHGRDAIDIPSSEPQKRPVTTVDKSDTNANKSDSYNFKDDVKHLFDNEDGGVEVLMMNKSNFSSPGVIIGEDIPERLEKSAEGEKKLKTKTYFRDEIAEKDENKLNQDTLEIPCYAFRDESAESLSFPASSVSQTLKSDGNFSDSYFSTSDIFKTDDHDQRRTVKGAASGVSLKTFSRSHHAIKRNKSVVHSDENDSDNFSLEKVEPDNMKSKERLVGGKQLVKALKSVKSGELKKFEDDGWASSRPPTAANSGTMFHDQHKTNDDEKGHTDSIPEKGNKEPPTTNRVISENTNRKSCPCKKPRPPARDPRPMFKITKEQSIFIAKEEMASNESSVCSVDKIKYLVDQRKIDDSVKGNTFGVSVDSRAGIKGIVINDESEEEEDGTNKRGELVKTAGKVGKIENRSGKSDVPFSDEPNKTPSKKTYASHYELQRVLRTSKASPLMEEEPEKTKENLLSTLKKCRCFRIGGGFRQSENSTSNKTMGIEKGTSTRVQIFQTIEEEKDLNIGEIVTKNIHGCDARENGTSNNTMGIEKGTSTQVQIFRTIEEEKGLNIGETVKKNKRRCDPNDCKMELKHQHDPKICAKTRRNCCAKVNKETQDDPNIKQYSQKVVSNRHISITSLDDVRKNLSDKEVFQKLLEYHDKEEEIAEKLSNDEEFFQSQMDLILSKESVEDVRVKSNDRQRVEQDRFATRTKNPPVSPSMGTIEEPPPTPNKKGKISKLFVRQKQDTVSINSDDQLRLLLQKSDQAIAERNKSSTEKELKYIKKDDDKSIVKFFKENEPFYEEKKRLLEVDNTSDMQYVSSKVVGKSPSIESNTSDCRTVKPKEIGKCFRRGFRPDNMMLAGGTAPPISVEEQAQRLTSNLKGTHKSVIDFSERETALDFLLALGFSIDEASNAIKDEDVKNRLVAAITEARVWVNQINMTQGTLLYLLAYKASPRTMRYFLQLVEAVINKRINNAVKLVGFLKLLDKVEDGDVTMIAVLGTDNLEDEENEEAILKKQLQELFSKVYTVANREARSTPRRLTREDIGLLRILSAKYRAGLHPHLELIAKYIGKGLLQSEIQLEAAMIYLSRLDTEEVNITEFEYYCAIKCREKQSSD